MTFSLSLPFEWNRQLSSIKEEELLVVKNRWLFLQKISNVVFATLGIIAVTIIYRRSETLLSFFGSITIGSSLASLPSQWTTFCKQRIESVDNELKKIHCLRKLSKEIAVDPKKHFNEAIEKIFGKDAPSDNLNIDHSSLIPVLSSVLFLQQEIEEAEQKKDSLISSLHSTEKNYPDSVESILQNRPDLLKIFRADPDFSLLSTLRELRKSQPLPSEYEKLKELYLTRTAKEKESMKDRWNPVFALEKQIERMKFEQIAVWAYLSLPEKDLHEDLSKYGLAPFEAWHAKGVKEIGHPSLEDQAIADLYGDGSKDNRFRIGEKNIMAHDISERSKKRKIVELLISAVRVHPSLLQKEQVVA